MYVLVLFSSCISAKLQLLQKELSEFVEDERTIKDEQLQESEVFRPL